MAIHDDPQKSCPHINEIINKGRKKAPEKKKKGKKYSSTVPNGRSTLAAESHQIREKN